MDDLSAKLDRLLNSPDGMKKIQDMMAAFGDSTAATPPPAAPVAPVAPVAPAAPTAPTAAPALPAMDGMPDMGMLLKLLPLFQSMGQEDENTALLHALRPHLKNGREKRLDDSMHILQLIKLLPLLQQGLQGDEANDG